MSDKPTAQPPTATLDAVKSDPDYRMRVREEHEQVQGTLFPNEELVVPHSVRTMKKAVAAIHAVPQRADKGQSLNMRRLFDACIMVAQMECRGKEAQIVERLKTERISPMFEVRISKLAQMAGIKGNNYERVYEDLDGLYDMSFAWNILEESGDVAFSMKAHYFSVLGYGNNAKRGLVRFAYDPSVLQMILEPSVWTKLSLDVLGGLKTAAAYALYQNAFRYLGTQNKVTAALPTHVWVELLVGKSRYVTESPDGQVSVNYADFKRRVLLDAIKRVNEIPALNYTLGCTEIKSGNRVAKLQFHFIPKNQRALELPLTWPDEVVRLLSQMKYSREEMDDLSQRYSVEEVAEAVTRLQSAEERMRAKGKPVTSRRAYFEGILRNISAGARSDEIEHDRIIAEVQEEEARKAAEGRLAKLKAQFERHQRDRFASWLFEQPASRRAELAKAFREAHADNPGVRMIVKPDLSEGDFSAQALLRTWITNAQPDLMKDALPHPEDRTFEDWMAWRLAGGDATDS